MSRAVIVVPCYEEADRLDLRRFLDFARRQPSIDFLLVNDGSKDRTLELLELLHANSPARFSFLHLARNGGKAEAVRRGMLMAFESNPEYVGFWDADLATPLQDIAAFCGVLDDKPAVDVVIAVRLPLLGRSIERTPARRWLGRLFARLASLALRFGIYDTQCGAKLFRATCGVRQACERPFRSRWAFDVELFARLRQLRLATSLLPLEKAIYEFPLDQWRDVAGSKVRAIDFFKSLGELARIYWVYSRPGAAGQRLPGLELPTASSVQRSRDGESKPQRAA